MHLQAVVDERLKSRRFASQGVRSRPNTVQRTGARRCGDSRNCDTRRIIGQPNFCAGHDRASRVRNGAGDPARIQLGDIRVPEYQTQFGIYEPNCGLEKVHLSWGHDEYIYRVTGKYLPEPAQYMLRYHSFYAAHRHGAYRDLMSPKDEQMLAWVQKFNPYDLYSKGAVKPNLKELKPYYEDLIAEFFPGEIDW